MNSTATGRFVAPRRWNPHQISQTSVTAPFYSQGERERENEAIPAYTASLCAAEMALEGEPRRKFIIEQANLPKRTDERKLRKLIAKGKKFLGVKKEV